MIQAIKGIDVILNGETVSNVLVGEPDGSGFTLAIPKGDAHSWIDTKVEFFGRAFRTIGFPKEGIENLLPLAWNKQVKVIQLITNADITLYEKDTYTRHAYKEVFFEDNRGSIVLKSGEKVKGNLEINLYAPNITDVYVPRIGDFVVGKNIDFEFDTASQQTVSESFKTFREKYPEYAVISNVSQILNAIKSDYTITAG